MADSWREIPWNVLGSLIVVVLFAPYVLDNVGVEIQYPDWLGLGLSLLALTALLLHVYTRWRE